MLSDVCDENNYKIIKGEIFNLNNLLSVVGKFIDSVDSYGANTTISYLGSLYKGITEFNEILPFIKKIGPDDYILLEINIGSAEEMKNINLLSFSMYSYEITINNEVTPVFASIDKTIQFFDKLVNFNSTVKICVTASKTIAKKFGDNGYLISKISLDLLNISNFNFLIRVGVNKTNNFSPNLRDTILTTFNQYCGEKKFPDEYYFSRFNVIDSLPKPYLPIDNGVYRNIQSNFSMLKDYLSANKKIVSSSRFYPYLSNLYNTDYAFQNVYDALTIDPPAQLQGNDTGKSYYSTDYLDFSNSTDGYLYIVALNHNASNVSLSSNIQIYEATNLSVIENGTIYTGPDYASTQLPSYPVPSIVGNTVPTYNIYCYSCKNLNEAGVSKVLIIERIQYSLSNFYHIPSNIYKGTGFTYIFKEPLKEELDYLKKTYAIDVQYITVPINKK